MKEHMLATNEKLSTAKCGFAGIMNVRNAFMNGINAFMPFIIPFKCDIIAFK